MEWLTSKSATEQNQLISFTITRARKYRAIRKEREAQTTSLYQKRLKEKNQKINRLFSARVERKIIAALTNMPDDFQLQLVSVLPEVDGTLLHDVVQYILDPTILSGKYIYHTWDMGDEGDMVYHGKILEVDIPKKKPIKLRIAYWLPHESEDDSADSSVKLSEALTDYTFSETLYFLTTYLMFNLQLFYLNKCCARVLGNIFLRCPNVKSSFDLHIVAQKSPN